MIYLITLKKKLKKELKSDDVKSKQKGSLPPAPVSSYQTEYTPKSPDSKPLDGVGDEFESKSPDYTPLARTRWFICSWVFTKKMMIDIALINILMIDIQMMDMEDILDMDIIVKIIHQRKKNFQLNYLQKHHLQSYLQNM